MNTKKVPAVPATGVFEKICTKCGKPKLVFDPETGKENFYKSSISKDGYHAWCKVCHNAHTAFTRKTIKKEKAVSKISTHAGLNKVCQSESACPKCGRILELTLENFHANPASKTGFKRVCKDCRNKDKRVRRGTEEGCMVLDFRDDMDLFGKLLAAAKKARRKPAMQVMATLESCL